MLTDTTVEAMLNNQFPTGTGTDRCYLSAHTDYSATGASLHGAKTAGAWAAAASRSKAITAAIDISITATATIKWIGAWGGTAGDTFRGIFPNASTGDKTFQVDLTNNTIVCEGHGWADTQKITFHGGTAPTGLTAGVTYFARDVTAADPDTFKVAATSGGAAIDLTGQAAAGCVVSNITEETYSSNGTHRVSTLTIDL
jgi:hypothetical protein